MSCPVCGRVNSSATGVPFPAESSRFVRSCHQLQIDPKKVDKKSLICFEHFDPRDHIKSGDKIVGISRSAIPKRVNKSSREMISNVNDSRPTLDRLLARNVGIGAPSLASSASSSSNSPIDLLSRSAAIGTPQNFAGLMPSTSSPFMKYNALEGLANRTLFISHRKAPTNSPVFAQQQYFKEWIMRSFNLPNSAIHEQSEVFYLPDAYFCFVVLDEQQTLETILTMYASADQNTYQCHLNSSINILMEGASILKKKKGALAPVKNLEECFLLLLGNDATGGNGTASLAQQGGGADDIWRNIAAAMLPAYRMISSNSPQPRDDVSSFATAMMNAANGSANAQPYPITNMMQQQQSDHFQQIHPNR